MKLSTFAWPGFTWAILAGGGSAPLSAPADPADVAVRGRASSEGAPDAGGGTRAACDAEGRASRVRVRG